MLTDVLKIVWRRKWFVALLTVTFLSMVFIALMVTKLTYESTAVIRIVRLQEPTSGLTHDDTLQEKLAFIETHKQMIKSRMVLERVIAKCPFLKRWVKSDEPDIKKDLLLKKLQHAIRIQSIRFTDILEISVRGRYPPEVAEVANVLAEVYQEWLNEESTKGFQSMTRFVNQRLSIAKKRLDLDESEIQAYKEQHTVVSIKEQTEDKLKSAHALEMEISNLGAKIEYLRDILARIKKDKESISLYVSLTDNEGIKELANQYDKLDLNIQLSEQYLQKQHPKYIELVSQRQNLVEKLHSRLIAVYESRIIEFDVNQSKKTHELEQCRESLFEMRTINLGMEKLERKFRTDEKAYLDLKQKLEESNVLKAKQSLVEVIQVSPAVPPLKHILPKRKKTLMMGILLGFLVALGITVLKEYQRKDWTFNVHPPELQPPL